jgi:hypothetical protein
MEDMGRWMLIAGILITLMGGLTLLIGKIQGLGRLPGDLVIQNDNFSCVIPIATSILLSIVATIVLNLILRSLYR